MNPAELETPTITPACPAEKAYTYDAFISYRHLPLDGAAAEKLQKLLEQYRPPKGIQIGGGRKHLRLFRDTTELPTSGSLDTALQRALLDSEYLIVVLSEETIHSKWCMAEIETFKEAHGGSISHILPLLVSGEPADIIPAQLRSATVAVQKADGSVVYEKDRVVEPLCADIRAESQDAALKKLKTEFLRLAAPLLGCGYDDLYRRHARRQRQLLIYAAAFFSLLAVSFGALALRIHRTEQKYEDNLVKTYMQQGASAAVRGDKQEALTYYGSALSVDNDSTAASSGSLLLLTKSRWPYLTNARDGSLPNQDDTGVYVCRFSDKEIELLDRDGGFKARLPRPSKMNPAVDPEFVGYYADSSPVVKCTDSSAFVRFGDYVYVYDIADGEAGLRTVLDLAEFFPEQAEKQQMLGWGEIWISEDGALLAMDSGSETAIVSMEKQTLEAMLTVYYYDLNSVVFSHDGQSFALVYRNYTGVGSGNPGGYIQVFDLNGELLFETGVSSDTAYKGADFSPQDTLLLAWEGSTLHFFEIASGENYAEPLECLSLDTAAFEGDRIVVDDGRGRLYDCAFTQLSINPDGYTDLSRSQFKWDKKTSDEKWGKNSSVEEAISIGDNLYITRKEDSVCLTDDRNTVLSRQHIDKQLVDRMCVAPRINTAYLWYHDKNAFFRLPYDSDRMLLGDIQELSTRGYEISDICVCGDGLAAISSNGCLLYYKDNDTTPQILKPAIAGTVRELVISEEGLAGVLIFANYTYIVELWDLHFGIRLASFETRNERPLYGIHFNGQGNLSYFKDQDEIVKFIDSTLPDNDTITAITQLPCFSLSENQSLLLRNPSADRIALGNWSKLLTVSQYTSVDDEFTALSEEERLIQEAGRYLRDKDYEGWLACYDGLWDAIADGSLALSFEQQGVLFRDYMMVARNNAVLTDRAGRGIEVYMEHALAQSMTEPYATLSFDLQMGQMLVLTGAYDELMADYWRRSADYALEQIRQSGEMDFLDYASVYENRMLELTVRGRGADAFREACREIGTDYLDDLLTWTGLGACHELALEEPEAAAEAFCLYIDSLMELDPRENIESLFSDIMMVMFEANFIERANGLKPEVMDSFLAHTGLNFGLQISKLSAQNRRYGLQPGDLVVAVEGHLFSNVHHMRRLQRLYPDAALSYIRDGKLYVTDKIPDWNLTGDFTVTEKP